ncbi:MAG: hypothetical protein AAGI54_06925 [Planctomycetota bacterium]
MRCSKATDKSVFEIARHIPHGVPRVERKHGQPKPTRSAPVV